MRFTQVTFRDMPHSAAIGDRIREVSNALEERHPQIQRCRVIVEQPGGPKEGARLKLTAEVRVADGEIVSVCEGAGIEAALSEVFAGLRQRLEERAERSQAA